MKGIIGIAGIVALTAAFAVPSTASANQVDRTAKQSCKQELREDPNEFSAQYGGTGKAAINKCARQEKNEAYRDCRSDRRSEPREFAREYGGTGEGALRRCAIDELR